jgi:hypothetical protein
LDADDENEELFNELEVDLAFLELFSELFSYKKNFFKN